MPKEDHGTAIAATPSTSATQLTWDKPETWQEKPPTDFRIGSYAVGDADIDEVDISISAFPNQAGGLLANINRWRGQINLGPVSEDELAGETIPVEIAGVPGIRINLVGPPGPDSSESLRIEGAVFSIDGSSWFFKMIGPHTAVHRESGAFNALSQSVRPVEAPLEEQTHRGADALMAAQAGAIPTPPEPDPFSYESPPNWNPQPPTPIRAASFLVSGDTGPDADMSVIALPGAAGGDLANVNRWRGQIALPPVTPSELADSMELIVSERYRFQLYDMAGGRTILEGGHKARILAAILKHGDTSWFFKMTGEDRLVAAEKAAFIEFLKSFHLGGKQ